MLISTATQEDVLGSPEPEIGSGKNHWNVDDYLPIDTVYLPGILQSLSTPLLERRMSQFRYLRMVHLVFKLCILMQCGINV